MTQTRSWRSFTRRYRWPLAVSAMILAAFIARGLWSGWTKADVQTAEIGRGDISASVNALGALQPIVSVDVGAQVSGQIVKLLVEPGDTVTKGQLLAEIDASIHQATVDAGRAQLAGLRAQLADHQAQAVLAGQQSARQRQLQEHGATKLEDVQSATAQLKSAEAKVANLRAQIEQTASRLQGDQAQLGYTRIYAPLSGTIIQVAAKAGQTLNATYQTPTILSIADLSRMTVKASVAEADIRHVKPAMTASFTTLGDEARRWEGKVRQVLPAPAKAATESAEPDGGKIVMYTVLFDVANADRSLMPEMTAQVSFTTQTARGVVVAPLRALSPADGKPGVYTARVLGPRNRLVEREVRIGRRDRMNGEILSGLAPGDRLVIGEAEAKES